MINKILVNIYTQPILTLQNKAIKHTFILHYLTPTKTVYSTADILSFQNIKKYKLLKFIYKVKNNLIKADVIPKLNSEIHNYQTRSASNFHINSIRTNFGKFAVLREAIHLFNELPAHVKDVDNFLSFKSQIKSNLINSQNTG
jgi:hypothetical protein